MAVNTADYHQQNFRLVQALGDKINAGEASFAPIGYDGMYLLIKAFPHPSVSGGEPIQAFMPGGGSYYEQAPIDTSFSESITAYETKAGTLKQFLRDVLANGGFFDARIYEGSPDRHTRSYLLRRCFIKLAPSERDWENKASLLQISGTLTGSYFGEEAPGNI